MQELKRIRHALCLKQPQMAERIGVTLSYYQKVEQGIVPAGRGFMEKFKKSFPDIPSDIFFKKGDEI